MDAVELLKSDHDVVDKLFQKVKATEESEHPAIFEKIKAELDVHAHIEEVIFTQSLKLMVTKNWSISFLKVSRNIGRLRCF